jgi:hypothetical protein
MLSQVRTLGVQVLLLASATLSVPAAAGPYQGYWRKLDVEDPTYAGYLKVVADSGYYCIMDGKSSFRFKLKGDFITTPMNGLNAITLLSASVLRISGEEKGEPYHSDWKKMEASEYPKACLEEEQAWYGPTALRAGPAEAAGPSFRRPAANRPSFERGGALLDILGRAVPGENRTGRLPGMR